MIKSHVAVAMVESELHGAAADAAAAANTTNLTEIAQDALLFNIKKCQELSGEVDKWINHVKENAGKGIPLLKRPAKAGARAFIALEHLSSEVYELQERWKVVNTVPENELDILPEEAPTYNLATARLTQLIGGWEKMSVHCPDVFLWLQKILVREQDQFVCFPNFVL